jgi:vitamin K-dependent gamma-carboxylase
MTNRNTVARKKSSQKQRVSFLAHLFADLDGSSLAVFRIAFGLIMHWEIWRYFSNDWIREYYIWPAFNFPYPLFEWVTPWAGHGMFIHFALLGVLSLFIATGLFYRISAPLFCIGITYIFLLEEANYLNHLYLICLLSFLLIFVPAHRRLSLDRIITGKGWPTTIPAWSVYLIGIQLAIAYFFGGVAKIGIDWLLARPLAIDLGGLTDLALVGPIFEQMWVLRFIAYSGLLLDLIIVPLLLWRRSRGIAFTLITSFHLLNAFWYQIGIFPWFMILATTIFFAPNWPQRLLARIRSVGRWEQLVLGLAGILGGLAAWGAIGPSLVPILVGIVSGLLIAWLVPEALRPETESPRFQQLATLGAFTPARKVTIMILAVWISLQVAIPLRHYAIPSVVHWTEEGHRFAWHMKLRTKDAQVRFFAYEPKTGEARIINPLFTLTPRQFRKMSGRPYMIRQFARYIKQQLDPTGNKGVEIRVDALASLNGRPEQRLIKPEVDLASVTNNKLGRNPWIMPLQNP